MTVRKSEQDVVNNKNLNKEKMERAQTNQNMIRLSLWNWKN